MSWRQFLWGSPRRTITTIGVVVGIGIFNRVFSSVIPTIINGIVREIAAILNPFIGWAILFFFLFMGYRIILSPFLPGKKRRK